MKILDAWDRDHLNDFLKLHHWLIENGFTLDDARKELDDWESEKIKRNNEMITADIERMKMNPKAREYLTYCPECDEPMIPIESELKECESELVCSKCSYSECRTISLFDYMIVMRELIAGREPEFKPDEIRETLVERERRRGICGKCEYLKGKACMKCGCSVKHRTYYKILSCPDKRW